jgi:hypothetical protein
MNTPVVILFFNRPDFLRHLIGRLSEVKPKRLYLVCDGPRQGKVGEREKVDECRALFAKLSWDCQICQNYSDINLGCRDRIISGLDWVFEQEERAIILEDDCIPILDFFMFAEAMLDRYKDAPQVMSIGGTNLKPQLADPEYDIVFSKYAMIWGWATWSRAWLLMDGGLDRLEEAKEKHLLREWLGSWRAEWYWLYVLKNVPTTWDYRWFFSGFIQHGLHVLPSKCLVENIGMTDVNATHTTFNPYDLPIIAKSFPSSYRVPTQVEPDLIYNQWMEDHFYSRALIPRIKWVVKKILNLLQRKV